MKNYEENRASITEILEKCVNGLNSNNRGLMNIYIWFLKESEVKVYESVEIGKQQNHIFGESWPEGFYATIKKDVKTTKNNKKSPKSCDVEVFNTELIYSRSCVYTV